MFTFSNFQFIPNCQKLWHLKHQFFLLFHTACISLSLPLSLFPFTRDAHMVCNVSQCVQILIFNISNTDSFTHKIYLWYKYYPKWICVSFSFQYIYFLKRLDALRTDILWLSGLKIKGGKLLCNLSNFYRLFRVNGQFIYQELFLFVFLDSRVLNLSCQHYYLYENI